MYVLYISVSHKNVNVRRICSCASRPLSRLAATDLCGFYAVAKRDKQGGVLPYNIVEIYVFFYILMF